MSVVIKKPLVDDREYRYVELPNGLDALLVQDPTTDKAAAALDVHVGSFSDPPDLPGLAHFLEHLLFMGTEKYPSENEYSQYIIEHGGLSNAFTSAEHTNFHFEVGWPHLRGCLDRFAQFFISPLFSETCKAREIMAVDSENKKNLQNDTWRFYQLEKHLSNPEHPLVKFSTGNYETLGRGPEQRGVDVRARLIEFYKQHYSASIMKLVIISRDSLDTLEQWTREFFTAIPNTHPQLATEPPFYMGTEALRKQDLGTIIKVEPVMDVKLLELTFQVPDQQPLYERMPYHYYVHLLGHESQGSLLYYLKEKRWASELGCAISHICKGTDYLFVNISLTNEGMENWQKVIEALFAYIQGVKDAGPQEWIFDEIKRTTLASFLYRQKSKAMPLSSSLAQVLHRPVPRENLLDYSVAKVYDEELIRDFAKYLVPSNVRAMLASKTLTGFDQTEPWYGTKFSVEPMPEFEIKEHLEHMNLPVVNNFLPDNFEIVHELSPRGTKTKQARPRLLVNTPELRLWHKLDDTFKIPKAHIFVKLIFCENGRTWQNFRAAKVFAALINDKLSDYAYYAEIADVSLNLATLDDGFEIEVQGFSEKLIKLLEVVVQSFCCAELREDRFDVIKEQQERTLSNLVLAEPYSQLNLHSTYLFMEHLNSVEERLNALRALKFDDVVEFANQMRTAGAGVEMLVIGNLNSKQAHESAAMVSRLVPSPSLASKNTTNHEHCTSFVYPRGKHYYKETVLADPANTNSALMVGYQFGQANTVEHAAMITLVAQILKEATFNQLRTKEQLGYIVGSHKMVMPGSLWFMVYAQSEASTQYLEQRVENYVKNVARSLLANMTEQDFKHNVDAVLLQLLERCKNLNDEADRYWRVCNDGSYDFKQNLNVARVIANITKEQVVEAFDEYVVQDRSRSRFALHLKAQALPHLDPQVALSRAVGQLVAKRQIKVTPEQIQGFMIECKGLSPQQALQKLGEKLCTDVGLAPSDSQDFMMSAVRWSQEIIVAAQQPDTSTPIGEPITGLPAYYESLTLGKRREPVESLTNFLDYDDDSAKL